MELISSSSFLRTCSYLIYITSKFQIWFVKTWIDFSNWKPTDDWVEEESERLICEIYTKTKFYKIYVVTVKKHYQRPKNLLLFWKYFHFWQWLIKYSVVLILTSLTWCSILHVLFIVQHLSTFKHCFCFFGFKHFRPVVLNRGGARPLRGARALTCSATKKIFERKCVPFKRYASANFTPLHVIWPSTGRDGSGG